MNMNMKLLDKEYGANKFPNGDAEDVAERLKDFFDQTRISPR